MGRLYVVATPIGNLEDITLRALRILKEVDFVLCEDTRVTRKLLDHYQINTPTLSFHQHSSQAEVNKLISLISQGKNLALVTDAGTPGLSDPGGILVAEAFLSARRCHSGFGASATEVPTKVGTKAGASVSDCQIVAIPGPSALTAAISISGWPMDKFLFLGFLPHKKGRQTLLKKIAASEYPVVLYESVHRINKLLSELSEQNYYLVVARELTKKFETVYRGTVAEVKSQLKANEIKGEFVVIIQK